MGRREYHPNQAAIDKKFKKGHGSGFYAKYLPYISVHDLSSKGWSFRATGWKTDRMYEFLSQLEYFYFLILDWLDYVLDILEQFPLPLEETIRIAKELEFRHPYYYTKENGKRVAQNAIMTVDFKLLVAVNGITKTEARDVKYVSDLTPETLQKLEISRLCLKSQTISHGLVTDKSINYILANNLAWVHEKYFWDKCTLFPLKDANEIFRLLTKLVFIDNINPADAGEIAQNKFHLLEGEGINICHYLIARKIWKINMNKPYHPMSPVEFVEVPKNLL